MKQNEKVINSSGYVLTVIGYRIMPQKLAWLIE